jgi:hypothetical protein
MQRLPVAGVSPVILGAAAALAAALLAALVLRLVATLDRRPGAHRTSEEQIRRASKRQRMEVASRLSFAVAVVALILLSCAWLIGAPDGA